MASELPVAQALRKKSLEVSRALLLSSVARAIAARPLPGRVVGSIVVARA